jgi:hypothetical protein
VLVAREQIENLPRNLNRFDSSAAAVAYVIRAHRVAMRNMTLSLLR